jgi:hypothetical protein
LKLQQPSRRKGSLQGIPLFVTMMESPSPSSHFDMGELMSDVGALSTMIRTLSQAEYGSQKPTKFEKKVFVEGEMKQILVKLNDM